MHIKAAAGRFQTLVRLCFVTTSGYKNKKRKHAHHQKLIGSTVNRVGVGLKQSGELYPKTITFTNLAERSFEMIETIFC